MSSIGREGGNRSIMSVSIQDPKAHELVESESDDYQSDSEPLKGLSLQPNTAQGGRNKTRLLNASILEDDTYCF